MQAVACPKRHGRIKVFLLAIYCSIGLLLSGCFIQSLHPFYLESMVVQVPETAGQWYLTHVGEDDVSAKYPEAWVFGKDAVVTFDRGIVSSLNIVWFRVGDTLFADLGSSAKEYEQRINGWWSMHSVAVHSVCKVILESGTMTFIPLNGEWLHDRIQKREIPLAIATVGGKNDHYVLTSSPQELAGFLAVYRQSPDAFPLQNAHVFKRSRVFGQRN